MTKPIDMIIIDEAKDANGDGLRIKNMEYKKQHIQ